MCDGVRGRRQKGGGGAGFGPANAFSSRREARKTFDERTLERQCDHEYLEELRNIIDNYDAVLSLACGVGVQFMAEKYHTTPLLPGVNTCFLGATKKGGALDRTLPGLRLLRAGHHCRYLSHFPVRQTGDERPLRRLQ